MNNKSLKSSQILRAHMTYFCRPSYIWKRQCQQLVVVTEKISYHDSSISVSDYSIRVYQFSAFRYLPSQFQPIPILQKKFPETLRHPCHALHNIAGKNRGRQPIQLLACIVMIKARLNICIWYNRIYLYVWCNILKNKYGMYRMHMVPNMHTVQNSNTPCNASFLVLP